MRPRSFLLPFLLLLIPVAEHAQVPDVGPVVCSSGGGAWGSCDSPAPARSAPGASVSASPTPLQSAVIDLAGTASSIIGAAFAHWLMGGLQGNPEIVAQQQQMMAELQRRQAEAARLHREEEAQRLAAIYNRLQATMKLSGLPELHMKDTDTAQLPHLQMKLGESGDTPSSGQVGVKGLPGIYLNDGNPQPYGIPGLPGTYVGGPGQGSELHNTTLSLKTGEEQTPAAQPANPASAQIPVAQAPAATAMTNESGLQLKTADTDTQAAQLASTAVNFDPSHMTPQQLADAAESFSKLPPEEQQRLLAEARQQATPTSPDAHPLTQSVAQPIGLLQQQVLIQQNAAAAPTPEAAAAGVGNGFDSPAAIAPTAPAVSIPASQMTGPSATRNETGSAVPTEVPPSDLRDADRSTQPPVAGPVQPSRAAGQPAAVVPISPPGSTVGPSAAAAGRATGGPLDMSLYANSSPREDALLNQLSQAMSDVNAHLQKATDLSRAGNSAAFAEELDQANGVLRKARVLADQLFTAQQDRMKEGMKILLQTHDYAEAWNSSVAIIRKEEMAAFASAQAEHDRVEAQFKLNHNDSAMLDRMQAADDRLRKAQVEAMERATKQLRAAANHLLDLSTGR